MALVLPTIFMLPGAWANSCSDPEYVGANEARAGTLSEANPYFWYQHVAMGPVTYTLVLSPDSAASLSVRDATNCNLQLCWDNSRPGDGTAVCAVSAGAKFRVIVYFDSFGGGGSYTLSFAGQPPTACSDNVDNDGDGRLDYPSDPGCASFSDGSESSECPELVAQIAFCLTPGRIVAGPVQEVEAYDGPIHHIAGYVDAYRFMTPGAGPVTIPCVTLLVDGETRSPCADAGGTYVSRTSTLVDETQAEPRAGLGADALVPIRICEADLVLLVGGFGAESAPAYAVC